MKEVVLKIDGMRCSMCEEHVNNEVRKLLDVKKVSSSASKNQTTIISKQDDIDINKLVEGINKTGYKVLSYTINDYQKKSLFSFKRK